VVTERQGFCAGGYNDMDGVTAPLRGTVSNMSSGLFA